MVTQTTITKLENGYLVEFNYEGEKDGEADFYDKKYFCANLDKVALKLKETI